MTLWTFIYHLIPLYTHTPINVYKNNNQQHTFRQHTNVVPPEAGCNINWDQLHTKVLGSTRLPPLTRLPVRAAKLLFWGRFWGFWKNGGFWRCFWLCFFLGGDMCVFFVSFLLDWELFFKFYFLDVRVDYWMFFLFWFQIAILKLKMLVITLFAFCSAVDIYVHIYIHSNLSYLMISRHFTHTRWCSICRSPVWMMRWCKMGHCEVIKIKYCEYQQE